MFAKVSVWWIDDLVGDSMRRVLCGLSWDGAKQIARRDEWRRLPQSFDGEVEWDRSPGNKTLPASMCTHTHTQADKPEHTHGIVQIKCAAGCIRPESERERRGRGC